MKIFGQPWDAPVCEGAEQEPAPVGEPCVWCQMPIEEEDRGVLVPCLRAGGVMESLPWHRECFLRSTVGSPAHIRGECSCHGGSEASSSTPEEVREEAREAWELFVGSAP